MARVDVALADQVKRYAGLHRQPLSVVIRDALALFMEEYPAWGDRTVPHQLTAHDFLSDRYEAPLDLLLAETDSAERDVLLSDTNTEVIHSILSDKNTVRDIASDRHGDEERVAVDLLSGTKKETLIASDKNGEPARMLSGTNADDASLHTAVALEPVAPIPPFDATRYRLGPLCKHGHEWGSTGMSLRTRLKAAYCLECDRLSSQARREAKKAKE
jgi:hypothetical protein